MRLCQKQWFSKASYYLGSHDNFRLLESVLQLTSIASPPAASQTIRHDFKQYNLVVLHHASVGLPDPVCGGARVNRDAAEFLGKFAANLRELTGQEGDFLGVCGQEYLNEERHKSIY